MLYQLNYSPILKTILLLYELYAFDTNDNIWYVLYAQDEAFYS